MNIVRTVTLVAGSAGLAIAAGTLFQSGSDPAQTAMSPREMAEQSPAVASLMPPSQEGGAARQPISAEAALSSAPEPRVNTAPAAPVQLAQAAPVDGQAAHDASACDATIVVTPQPGAMLEISLYAPCQAGAPLDLAHGPLRVAANFGGAGEFVHVLPALSQEAEVRARLSDGAIISDSVTVEDFAAHDRYILQWRGDAMIELHAYLPGASFGGEGHVMAGSPVSAEAGAMTAQSGREGLQSRVYTWPAGQAARASDITLETEISVTEANCGQAVSAEAWLVPGGGRVEAGEVQVVLPDCAAAGGFVSIPGLAVEQPQEHAAAE